MNDIATTTAKVASLPRLIERAAASLAQATTAAEVLDAERDASAVYDMAKNFKRLAEAKGAHDTVLAACQKAMADALVIQGRAQVRLADEYDAAQKDGSVATGRDGPGADVSHGNAKATAAAVGVTRLKVHEARQVRDAEKAQPGVIKQTVEAKVAEGKDPTKADVKRAVAKANAKPAAPRPFTRGGSTPKLDVAREVVRKKMDANEAVNPHKLEKEHGISHVTFDMAVTAEVARKEALLEQIDVASLPKTNQEKLAIALRQQTRRLDAEFALRVDDKVKERVQRWWKMMEQDWNERYAGLKQQIETVMKSRHGIMDAKAFRLIASVLHSDFQSDPAKKKRHDEAFVLFNGLKAVLLSQKEHPVDILPDDADEWQERIMKRDQARGKKGKNAVT